MTTPNIFLRTAFFFPALLCAQLVYGQNSDDEGPRGWPGGFNVSGGYTRFAWQHADLENFKATYNSTYTASANLNQALGKWVWKQPYSAGAELDFGLISLAYYRHFATATARGTLQNGNSVDLLVKTPSNDYNMYLMLPLTKVRIGILAGYTQQNLSFRSTYIKADTAWQGNNIPSGEYKVVKNAAFTFGGRLDIRPIKYVSVSIEYNNVAWLQKDNISNPLATKPRALVATTDPTNTNTYFPNSVLLSSDQQLLQNGGPNASAGIFTGGRWMVRLNFYPWSWY
jgi:hypothetical protein